MKKILVALAFIVGISAYSNAGDHSKYFIDDNAVDVLFSTSSEVNFSEFLLNPIKSNSFANAQVASSNDAIVATIICFFLGSFGVHRHYLGTKGSMWAIYLFTCGGIFGVVPLVDFVVLIVDGIVGDNVGRYQNNDNFFMWGN